MKKLSLLGAALLFAAGIGFAQSNIGTITQIGLNNDGVVHQVGSNNTGTILSVGNLHNDNVTRWGNWRSGTSALMLAKGVTQTGSYNYGLINQVGYDGVTMQLPNDVSKAGIGQDGILNNAQIFQSDNTVHTWSAQNNAFVDQLGNYNISLQNQIGRASQSYFRQVGNSNNARSDQYDLYGDYAIAEQVGNNNTSYQLQQTGFWEGSKSDIYQKGDYNTANTYQTGKLNEVVVLQDGLLNTANVTQVGNRNNDGYWINTGYATVEQKGNYNSAAFTQIGDDNEEMIYQDGNSNTAILEQIGNYGYGYMEQKWNGASYNYAKVVSIGNENRHFTVQTYGDYNTINTTQIGNNNESFTGQYVGNLNIAETFQNGNLNKGNIEQHNNYNNANITQIGNSNNGVVYQN